METYLKVLRRALHLLNCQLSCENQKAAPQTQLLPNDIFLGSRFGDLEHQFSNYLLEHGFLFAKRKFVNARLTKFYLIRTLSGFFHVDKRN